MLDSRACEWVGFEELRRMCQRASLSPHQAQIVLLRARDWSHRAIATVYRVRRREVRNTIRFASAAIWDAEMHFAKECIQACKNRQIGGSPAPLVYDELGRAVTQRATMVEVEDLLQELRRFLNSLD